MTTNTNTSIQCAQILWRPAYSIFEYRCSFCQESFLKSDHCLDHLKICRNNFNESFDTRYSNVRGDDVLPDKVYFQEDSFCDAADDPPTVGASAADHPELHYIIINENIKEIEPNSKPADNKTSNHSNRKEFRCPRHQKLYDASMRKAPPKTATERKNDINTQFLPKGEANAFSILVCRNLGVLECDLCGKKRSTRRGMLAHMVNFHHFIDVPIECPHCPRTFLNKKKLKKHIYTHTYKGSCEYCGKVFNSVSNLNVHIRTHTKVRPYECSLCDMSYQTSNDLNVHMMKHRGEKPHKCEYCPKAFLLKTQLNNHLNTHTREKVYTCDECGKILLQKESLKRHKMVHAGEKPHECTICGKYFRRPKELALHMNTHTGSNPYACKFCERRFNSPSARRSHLKNVHKLL